MGEQSTVGTVPAGRWRRIGRRIGLVLLARLLALLLIWALMFLRVLVWRPHVAQQEATAGLERARSELDRLAAADGAALNERFGAPLGTTRTVLCELGRVESGWWVVGHSNSCTLREVEVRAVPEDRPGPAREAIRLLADVPAWEGERYGGLIRAGATCAPAAATRVEVEQPGLSDVQLAAVAVEDLGALHEDCVEEAGASARAIDAAGAALPESAPPADTPGDRLVVVREVGFSHTELGCLPVPLVCEPAVSEARLPDIGSG